MAWHLIGAMSVIEPMLEYSTWDLWEHISVKFSSKYFYARKVLSEDGSHVVAAANLLIHHDLQVIVTRLIY